MKPLLVPLAAPYPPFWEFAPKDLLSKPRLLSRSRKPPKSRLPYLSRLSSLKPLERPAIKTRRLLLLNWCNRRGASIIAQFLHETYLLCLPPFVGALGWLPGWLLGAQRRGHPPVSHCYGWRRYKRFLSFGYELCGRYGGYSPQSCLGSQSWWQISRLQHLQNYVEVWHSRNGWWHKGVPRPPQQPDQRRTLVLQYNWGPVKLKMHQISFRKHCKTVSPWGNYCGKRENAHSIDFQFQSTKKQNGQTSHWLKPSSELVPSLIPLQEYAFTSPFPLQHIPHIFKWPTCSSSNRASMHSTAPQCAELALDRMICLWRSRCSYLWHNIAGCLQEEHPTCHGKILSRPSVHLTIMSLVGRSRHDFETQVREECELGFCPTGHVPLSQKRQ